jgi:hypothetical protein
MSNQRNIFRGMSGGIFLIFLALAFLINGYFLPLLFVGLALSSLFGSLSSPNPWAARGGIQGFVWFFGLAVCFALGFWPWILVVVGVSAIVGAMSTNAIGTPKSESVYTPPAPQPASDRPYQQGYQPQEPPQRQPETYEEGGKQHSYPPQQSSQYEQPQAQYPKEMPPQQ